MTDVRSGVRLTRTMLFILFPAGVVMYLRPGFLGIFLVVYLTAALLLKIDSRLSVGGGLVYLLLSLIFLLSKVNGLAEAAAETAYVFFVVGVISAIAEYLRTARAESVKK